MTELDQELIDLKAKLQGSFLLFCQYFYKVLNGRELEISNPIGREPHVITCAREFTKCLRLESTKLIINLPPGYGKSTLATMWVAWAWSIYPDSHFIYTSYAAPLAIAQTETIRRIVSLFEYRVIFGIKIENDAKAKHHFRNNFGGVVYGAGGEGTITGFNAGVPSLENRFTGALIMDDMHKPDEVHSDSIREKDIRRYLGTLRQRVRSVRIPQIFIGQRLREGDLPDFLKEGGDGSSWNHVILSSLDEHDNALYPEMFPKEYLIQMREIDPYNFWAQQQQQPTPAGGGLFKIEYFKKTEKDPDMLLTFLTVDTAETEKTFNDATVFSFFGLYKIKDLGYETEKLALHWIDCYEIRIEPKDLHSEFMQFLSSCMRYKTPPSVAAIEKKSTGVTLLSSLSDIRGIEVRNIERDRTSKTQRFIEIQPFVYKRLISIPEFGKHTENTLKHMSKITANNSHRFDDIADTLADACRIAFIDKTLYYQDKEDPEKERFLQKLAQANQLRTQVSSQVNQYGIHYGRR